MRRFYCRHNYLYATIHQIFSSASHLPSVSLSKILASFAELTIANKIDNRTKKIIQDFLDKLDDKNVYVEESVKYTDFKAYKQSMIKILLYNNQDKITKDIASLLM